jgi:hypothetical protein
MWSEAPERLSLAGWGAATSANGCRARRGLIEWRTGTATMKKRTCLLTCISPVLYRENGNCPGIARFPKTSTAVWNEHF